MAHTLNKTPDKWPDQISHIWEWQRQSQQAAQTPQRTIPHIRQRISRCWLKNQKMTHYSFSRLLENYLGTLFASIRFAGKYTQAARPYLSRARHFHYKDNSDRHGDDLPASNKMRVSRFHDNSDNNFRHGLTVYIRVQTGKRQMPFFYSPIAIAMRSC